MYRGVFSAERETQRLCWQQNLYLTTMFLSPAEYVMLDLSSFYIAMCCIHTEIFEVPITQY